MVQESFLPKYYAGQGLISWRKILTSGNTGSQGWLQNSSHPRFVVAAYSDCTIPEGRGGN